MCKYPEHEKLANKNDAHQWVCEFAEFLETRVDMPDGGPRRLIAEFFRIDIEAFDAEEDAMNRKDSP